MCLNTSLSAISIMCLVRELYENENTLYETQNVNGRPDLAKKRTETEMN